MSPTMNARRALPITLCLLAACAGADLPDAGRAPDAGAPQDAGEAVDAGASGDAGGPADAGDPSCPAVDGEVVQLTTEDGETLAADLYTSGQKGGRAVVLLHMIPPTNTRRNYPRAFIDALLERGISVLNVDRRGAGGSTGRAQEAYTGPNGKWDAKAAVDFLVAHPCAPDPGRIGVVGASNGTTTALDYAVYAAGAAGAVRPAALVFLTGGAYTETNTRVSAQRAVLEPLPIQLVFSTAERAWSAGLQGTAPSTWRFEEYDPGDHGTRMLTVRPEASALIGDFLQDALP
jgi:pimeloyl-ACP methyl ester carboxylesterase